MQRVCNYTVPCDRYCSSGYGAYSGVNQGWRFSFCLIFFRAIKLSIPERMHSEMMIIALDAVCLKKNLERSFCHEISETVSSCLRIATNPSMVQHIRGCLRFGIKDTD